MRRIAQATMMAVFLGTAALPALAQQGPLAPVAYVNARLIDPATGLDQKGALITDGATIADVGTRLFNPNWIVSYAQGLKLSIPMGFAAGMLQGASGVSAPVSLSFLNAMRMERATFISTVSILFAAMTAFQIPTLAVLGIASWYEMALSAAALVPLTLWFVASVIVLSGASHGEVVLWMARPHNTVLLLALIGATFWHAALGLQVVIEDYIRKDTARLATMLAMKVAMLLLALFAAVAVLKVAL